MRAGLWGDVKVNGYRLKVKESAIDWGEILRLAEEQSVVGLVAAGIEAIQGSWTSQAAKPSAGSKFQVPQEWALQFIGQTLQIEQRNKEVNDFIGKLSEKLRSEGVSFVMVKGQGVAQCYEKPLWRACGDVDLLLSKDNYEKAKEFLKPLASHIEEEDAKRLHLGLTIDGWVVELHGTLYTCFSARVNKLIAEAQSSIFNGGEVRSWDNGNTTVYLPSPDNDMILVFTHILEHFFIEGVGLRQICDWCRLLLTHKGTLNVPLLEARLRKAGIMTEWKAFASLAVDRLGMPKEVMPFYDERYRRKGERVLRLVMEAGNFGHNKDLSYRTRYKGVMYKMVSLWRRIGDFVRFLPIFPLDAPRFFITYVFGKMR